eukprot:6204669-Pleurochrysis_carterae.AAC.3
MRLGAGRTPLVTSRCAPRDAAASFLRRLLRRRSRAATGVRLRPPQCPSIRERASKRSLKTPQDGLLPSERRSRITRPTAA